MSDSSKPKTSDAETGLPLLRTWRSVYWFVFAVFVVWIVGLALFTRAFA